jgi:hypothetical protein
VDVDAARFFRLFIGRLAGRSEPTLRPRTPRA